MWDDIYCAFCLKKTDKVKSLVAGREAFICEECVETCYDILAEHGHFDPEPPGKSGRREQ